MEHPFELKIIYAAQRLFKLLIANSFPPSPSFRPFKCAAKPLKTYATTAKS